MENDFTEVYVTTGKGANGKRIVHVYEDCGQLNHSNGTRKVSPKLYPHRKLCEHCEERMAYLDLYGKANGVCPSCHGKLNDIGQCLWCCKYNSVFEEDNATSVAD